MYFLLDLNLILILYRRLRYNGKNKCEKIWSCFVRNMYFLVRQKTFSVFRDARTVSWDKIFEKKSYDLNTPIPNSWILSFIRVYSELNIVKECEILEIPIKTTLLFCRIGG